MKYRNGTTVRIALMIVALLVAAAGCQPSRTVTPPETFPISGKVTVTSGENPAGLLLNFIALDDPEKTATAIIEKDGAFQLNTKYIGVKCEGAATGKYRVRLERLDGETVGQLAKPIDVSGAMNDLSLKF